MLAQRKISAKNTTQDSNQPEFNLTYLIRQIHFRRDISNGAKLVGVHLLMASGRRGYCSIAIKQLAWELDMRLTQIHIYLNELIKVGYLFRQSHTGRPNTWIIPSVRTIATTQTPSVHRRTIYKSKYKENVYEAENAISLSTADQEQQDSDPPPQMEPPPKRPPIRMDIVKRLLEITNDKKSFAFWCKVSRDIPITDIDYAISALQLALNDYSVNHPGRYITKILKERCPEAFSNLHNNNNMPTNTRIPAQKVSEPIVQTPKVIDHDLNLSAVREILRSLERDHCRTNSSRRPLYV